MPRRKQDPLLAALIAKLPQTGAEWPVDQQLGWLNLMAMALGAVYGGDVAAKLGRADLKPIFMPVQPKAKKPAHAFYIDESGYVRNGAGKAVLPKDVTGEIYDTRGIDADLRTITWADGTTGLNGADLTITSA
jgi:hypothetical protein